MHDETVDPPVADERTGLLLLLALVLVAGVLVLVCT